VSEVREETMHDGLLVNDLKVPLDSGALVLPFGSRLVVTCLIAQGEIRPDPFQSPARQMDVTIEYRVTVVAERMTILTSQR
jgi:hypothetical protein